MAQHDYVIDNQSAPSARADINSALSAIVTQNSGATAPATTYADMVWYDTANNQIKKRNEANSAWITLGTINESTGKFDPNASFTAVEQGGGPSQSTNKVNMGWSALGMYLSVDGISQGRIVVSPDAAGASSHQPTQIFAPGQAPLYGCRAWVNFNGQGTVSIRASGNVSSITDFGTGSYTVNFTTPMIDAYYAATVTHFSPNTTTYPYMPVFNGQSAGGFAFQCITASVGLYDPANVHCAFFR
jgi:hypothetical protein